MKKVLILASLMAMAVSAAAYAAPIQGEFVSKSLFKDVNGNYHYVQAKEAKSIMDIDQVKKTGMWVVDNPGKNNFVPRPVHEVLSMSVDEYEAMLRSNNGGDAVDAE